MKVLFVNPNQFSAPPCVPVGLEYAAGALLEHGHEVEVCDLFHFPDPVTELDRVLQGGRFDFAAVTVRNIDSAQAARFQPFIPGIRVYVQNLQAAGLKVVLGGCGFSAMPGPIMEYTGADAGVCGPGELVFPGLCAGGKIEGGGKVVDAWRIGIEPDFTPVRAEAIKYEPYLRGGGVVGFATQYGCTGQCLYCVEAGTPVLKRNPAAVVDELAALRAKGFEQYHLCDAEFNQELAYCMSFLDELRARALDLRWALYMKPKPVSDDLFWAIALSGANAVTLSVDSAAASEGRHYTWEDVAFCVRACRKNGIKLAIDLTIGLPGEPDESSEYPFEFFRRERPDIVNVNSFLRVYGGTKLEALLRRSPEMHEHLSGPLPPGPPLEKLFYNHFTTDRIKELIADDALFKLEGFEPGVNYEFLKEK